MATWFCKENVKWLHKLPLNIHLQRPTTVFGHITSTQWQRCVALSLSSHCATKNSEWSLTSISYHIISQKKTFHWFLAPSSNWPVFLFSSMWTGIYCSEHRLTLLNWNKHPNRREYFVSAGNYCFRKNMRIKCFTSCLKSKSWNLQFVCAHMQCFMYRVGRLNIYQIISMQLWILLLMVVFLKYAVLHKLGVIPLF